MLITGASRGLGLELAKLLAVRKTRLTLVARNDSELNAAAAPLRDLTDLIALPADVSQGAEDIVRAANNRFGGVDVLINNASELGPSPMPALESLPWEAMERILRVNAIAPLHLIQLVLPKMRERGGTIVNISSDAAVNAYPGWGGYGASKAALEHISRTLIAESDGSPLRVLIVDPGDMNTEMHRLAEPGVDLSHLPDASRVAPSIVALIEDDAALSGRYQAQALAYASR